MMRLGISRLISPVGFVVLAILICLAYLAADSAGWRQYTGVISGTPSPGASASGDLRGLAYAGLYFANVLLAPILLLAAVMLLLIQRRTFRVL